MSDAHYAKAMQKAIGVARQITGLEQEDFATELRNRGVRVSGGSRVSRWENGQAQPSAAALIASADLAGRSLDELLGRSDHVQPQWARRMVAELREEFSELRRALEVK